MGKIQTRVYHKDKAGVLEDHAHKLPNGSYTGGQLLKPNSDQSFPHTHLYEHEGKTLETGRASLLGDHVHESVCGESTGPVPVVKDSSQGIRTDSLHREGSKWVKRSETGHLLGRFDSLEDAKKDDSEAQMDSNQKEEDRPMFHTHDRVKDPKGRTGTITNTTNAATWIDWDDTKGNPRPVDTSYLLKLKKI